MSAFVDDTTFVIKDVYSVNRILKHMKLYEVFSSLRVNMEKSEACWIGSSKGRTDEVFSSLRVNMEKSEACWIGSSKGRTDKPLKCKWVCIQTDTIKILGIIMISKLLTIRISLD